MPEAILICGKICSGKTVYAKKIVKDKNAVLLSCDEITFALFGQHIGERHDEITRRTKNYLFSKSLEVIAAGASVILDFGFWSRAEREEANAFYKQHNITPQWHYVDVSEELWQRNIKKRNDAIAKGVEDSYIISDTLAAKFERSFEEPSPQEIDVWYKNDWE